MIGRIQRSADFERVLGTPSRARSSHFVLHHLASAPSRPGGRFCTGEGELSTAAAPDVHKAVDESPGPLTQPAPQGHWLGCVVPKRHARRAVTRNLLKRQIRAAFAAGLDAEPALPAGLWVVRLRAPFDPKQYPSAASDALRHAARAELETLLERARQPQRGSARPAPRGQA